MLRDPKTLHKDKEGEESDWIRQSNRGHKKSWDMGEWGNDQGGAG